MTDDRRRFDDLGFFRAVIYGALFDVALVVVAIAGWELWTVVCRP